ncbi:glycine--tRNA ligase subunit beta [Zavarzinia sp. CC-PAN008]|uniref:glycine--tRNA ligase subunit beta n=1 Tax=Zavarzinia sp. CC-PAN008 TaxID=3243332 RepID=UPI003F742176
MPDFLLEIFGEEIPSRMQARAAADLKHQFAERLKAQGIAHGAVTTYVTPRRLALIARDLPAAQADQTEERRGPRVGAPDKAVDGFLASAGITRDQAEEVETDKGRFYVARLFKPGRRTVAVLGEIVAGLLWDFAWPKSMRWGAEPSTGLSSKLNWVRPIHGVIALFDGDVVTLPLTREGDAGHGIAAGRSTQGHRFMSRGPVTIDDPHAYVAALREAKVMAVADERRDLIARAAAELAFAKGLEIVPDEGLLDEVTGLVEWPVPLMGRIDDAFMDLPPEVLATAMRTHQKYFAVRPRGGTGLAPWFITVANIAAPDGGARIVAGNERVLRARLSDARFFWDSDRKETLESRVAALSGIVFHAKLGTVAQKIERVRALAKALLPYVPGADAAGVDRAALLAKADLVSGMVGEFPELQGIMGRYYARLQGESDTVAEAIAEHWQPQGPGDACPTAPVSVVVALADKLDTLAGFFGVNEKPTGSKDPFALRRAALGVIRLVLENRLRVALLPVFAAAARGHGQDGDTVAADLLAFFIDRLRVHLREQGKRHDLVAAVLGTGTEDDIVRLIARVEALAAFLGTDDGANLLAAQRRAGNILRIEQKKSGERFDQDPDPALYAQDEERALAAKLGTASAATTSAVAAEDYAAAMAALATLRAPVDAFFDRVTVNAPEAPVRANRLALLSRINATMALVADFARIEG